MTRTPACMVPCDLQQGIDGHAMCFRWPCLYVLAGGGHPDCFGDSRVRDSLIRGYNHLSVSLDEVETTPIGGAS